MPGIKTVIHFKNLNKVLASFKTRQKKLADPSPGYKRCAVFLDQWWQKNFKSDGGMTKAGEWEPLSEVTQKIKAHTGKTKMMYNTGRMKASIDKGSGSNRRSAWIKTSVAYAEDHQYGTKEVPKRQLLPTKNDVVEDMRRIMGDWVKVSVR